MPRRAEHERDRALYRLICHPDTPAIDVSSVEVELRSGSSHSIGLCYQVRPARTLTLPEWASGPIDGLWRSTCFELFVRSPSGPEYREFNFAPACGWAAYAFADYRSGMSPLSLDRPPHVVDRCDANRARGGPDGFEFRTDVDRDSWPRDWAAAGLSAVIQETDGTKSYWALRHPPGAPDFHHPDCFALELPALG